MNRDAENVIAVCQTLSDAEIDAKTPEILGNHPNTYTITKHMAEHEVQNAEEQFPCAIVRPSMSKKLLSLKKYSYINSLRHCQLLVRLKNQCQVGR